MLDEYVYEKILKTRDLSLSDDTKNAVINFAYENRYITMALDNYINSQELNDSRIKFWTYNYE